MVTISKNVHSAQRIKGAIDSRIAEEQARQVRQQQQVRQTPPRRRPPGQDGAAARLATRQREALAAGEKGPNPDPSEFEPEFAIGTDESAGPSRVATPRPEPVQPDTTAAPTESTEENINPEGKKLVEKEAASNASESNENDAEPVSRAALLPDLPADVKAKLRKLDRLESKYAELLRAYRTAHVRVQIIEPFESALRENTPLTSITDPSAFVEYLSQVNLKSSMVLDELKRVSTERDQIKKKSEELESENTRLRAEAEAHIAKGEDLSGPALPEKNVINKEPDIEKSEPGSDAVASPKSTSSRVPSLSFFSPKPKPLTSPTREATEDLFSYDSEVPRLETELGECHSQIEQLTEQVDSLQNDLKVARESTESMVQTLETTTNEVNNLREAKTNSEIAKADLERRIAELKTENASNRQSTEQDAAVAKLQKEKMELCEEIQQLKERINASEIKQRDVDEELQSSIDKVNFLNERLSQKDSIAKDLEDSLAMAKAAQRDEAKHVEQAQSSERKIATLQGIVDNLRSQLRDAESDATKIKQDSETQQKNFDNRPSTKVFGLLDADEKLAAKMENLQSREEVIQYLNETFGHQHSAPSEMNGSTKQQPEETTSTTSNKKKNKKKKKGKPVLNTVEEPEVDAPVKVSEDLSQEQDVSTSTSLDTDTRIQTLTEQLSSLQSELEQKATTIDRLSKRLKDEEALQEEIETLRDDLLHQGEEHVEARDKLKNVTAERDALQQTVESLEKELAEVQKKANSGIESEKAHKELIEQYEDLKTKSNTMQTDLEAAQQLASARFKDITDVRELLNKAQPELRSLRNEVEELRSAKEELKNKTGELSRLESKHGDLKTELKALGKWFSEQDGQTKDLQNKIEQESKMREKVEGELSTAQSEIRVVEAKRRSAAENSEESAKNLARSKEELVSLRNNLRELEEQAHNQDRQILSLKEEVSLKTALHGSSQSLVQSLRDQAHELNVQAREAISRAENLEEELAEAQRMLSERTREGQTMRMLLNQTETGSEGRVREMKERMDTAIEERDRIEDEANVNSRRMMREVEDAKIKARDAQRQLKVLEDEKDELEVQSKEWKRRRLDLEKSTEASLRELEEVRVAMKGLREALDESERQVREAENQRTDLRRQADESTGRIEKLSRANKNLTDEIKSLQSLPTTRKPSSRPGLDSGLQSSRSSIDSSTARSPAPTSRTPNLNTRVETPPGAGLSQGTVDYVYLKNVLLQFLTQKDKSHQRQLIPVLAMLLHFDQKDEQRWNAAISTR